MSERLVVKKLLTKKKVKKEHCGIKSFFFFFFAKKLFCVLFFCKKTIMCSFFLQKNRNRSVPVLLQILSRKRTRNGFFADFVKVFFAKEQRTRFWDLFRVGANDAGTTQKIVEQNVLRLDPKSVFFWSTYYNWQESYI